MVTMPGKKVSSNSTANIGIKNGAVPLKTCSIGVRNTELITNNTLPTGGVNNPIIRFKIMMTPKCTGSTPNSSAIGNSTGTVIKDDGRGVDERTQNYQQEVDDQQEHDRAGDVFGHHIGQVLWHLLAG